jgi:hypothetical protein
LRNKNKTLLRTRDDFNKFTKLLKVLTSYGPVQCLTRNDTLVKVSFKYANDPNTESDTFYSPDYAHVWYNDGSSVKNDEWDLIEIVE